MEGSFRRAAPRTGGCDKDTPNRASREWRQFIGEILAVPWPSINRFWGVKEV